MATEASLVKPVITIRSDTTTLTTGADQPKPGVPNFSQRQISATTEISAPMPKLVLAPAAGRADDDVAQPEPIQAKTIDAVVLDVSDVSVALSCHTPGSPIRILLPRDLVPKELARYGTSVALSLAASESTRYPTVSAREYKRNDKSPAEIAIDRWIDTL